MYNPIIQGQTKENYPLVIRYGKGNPQLIHGFPREKPFLELNCHVWAIFARYDNCVLTISNYLMAFSDMPPTGSLGSQRSLGPVVAKGIVFENIIAHNSYCKDNTSIWSRSVCVYLYLIICIYTIHCKLYLIIFNHIFSNDIFISFHLTTIQEWNALQVGRQPWHLRHRYHWHHSEYRRCSDEFGSCFFLIIPSPLKFNTIKHHQKTMVDFIGDVHIN